GYFSVGLDVDYYQCIAKLSITTRATLLGALKVIVCKPNLIEIAQDEDVFKTSLLRNVSLSVIKGQVARVLNGSNPLTNFKFKFVRPAQEYMSGIELKVDVQIDQKP
ncbi:hypothetical protein V6259_19740, partial [Marinomonas sp. TI.3.20]|uniref:hypothetical protein n=1 Tax=Marinomonas sp. TI.3.20 TaxID=3121296 RepID=UPI00312AC898